MVLCARACTASTPHTHRVVVLYLYDDEVWGRGSHAALAALWLLWLPVVYIPVSLFVQQQRNTHVTRAHVVCDCWLVAKAGVWEGG